MGVAFISDGALTLLDVFLQQNTKRLRRGRILLSLYNSFNSKAVLERLKVLNADSGKLQVRVSANPHFHWKYDHFYSSAHQAAFVGSANFTNAGLREKGELTTRFRLSRADKQLSEDFKRRFDTEWDDARSISDLPLDHYKQEKAPASGGLHPEIKSIGVRQSTQLMTLLFPSVVK
ncbi:MAG: hypothetical protein EOO16_22130 [Chitinophagaceae bacterium]|nr:MAG: hypothetical protein EOO16_22130 [Chitinophagaceae bacterium]